MSDLYGDDILLWSERQAALLRRMGAGERVNDLVDWENVAEEIESVGERRSVLDILKDVWTNATPEERTAFDAWRKSTAGTPDDAA